MSPETIGTSPETAIAQRGRQRRRADQDLPGLHARELIPHAHDERAAHARAGHGVRIGERDDADRVGATQVGRGAPRRREEIAALAEVVVEQVRDDLLNLRLITAETFARDLATLEHDFLAPLSLLWSAAGRKAM